MQQGEQLRYNMGSRSCRASRTIQVQHGRQVQHGEQLSTAKKATQDRGEQGMQSMGNSSSTEWGAALVLHREQLR
jgi:hypothetical protein